MIDKIEIGEEKQHSIVYIPDTCYVHQMNGMFN